MINQWHQRRFFTLAKTTPKTICTWAALVFVTVWVFLPGVLLGAEAAPRTVLAEERYDFGQIFEDRELTHTFVIRNTSQEPLEIRNVDPDCACTVPRYNSTIPPGGQGEITLTIKPYSAIHRFYKVTRVTTNDPERPAFSLLLTGDAQPFIEIQPSHIVRLRGRPGEEVRGQVQFSSHLPGPFKITGYHTNIPDKIEMSLKTVQPDRVYLLEVKNRPGNQGPYGGLIELDTTSTERPRLIVRVFGEIYLPSAVNQ